MNPTESVTEKRPKSLSDLIRIKLRGKTQAQLADELGVHRIWISNRVNGDRRPIPRLILERMSDLWHMPEAEIEALRTAIN